MKNKMSGVKTIYFFIFLVISILIAQTIIVCTGVDGNSSGDYVIFASNDLGMHCIQNDYSRFLILPPANTIHVQVFKKGGEEATPVKQNIEVSYSINNNTTSSDKVNYWEYAGAYGFDNTPDIGITGNGLSGSCVLVNNLYFEATAIPVVPYDDGSAIRNPYQTATITVKDSGTNTVLAETTVVVVPVSDEMLCSTCHDPGAGKEDDFLAIHDLNHDTSLESTPTLCADCHKDNALGAPGDGTSPSLSAAMHGFHATRMDSHPLPDTNQCYACHPGPETKCLRGVMASLNITCSSTGCHGYMADVGNYNREAWIDEPSCASTNCHTSAYAPNAGKLYRNSVLLNGPEDMNNKILCVSCHNSPHSEWPSSLSRDNELPVSITGDATYITKCSACHSGSGIIHGGGNDR